MRTIIVVAVAVLVAGCAAEGSGGGREQVVASFYPLAFAAQEVGGAGVDVANLTPPGVEPHDLEVSPRDVQRIRSADLVLLLGRGFQPQLERAAGSGEHVVRLLDARGVDPLPNGDPHVWLDPVRFAAVVRRIGAALHRERAAARLVARLRALDARYRRGLAHCARREIVTSHEAFAYVAGRYGLRQVAITGVSPEAEPAPRDLERAVDEVRETGATTVFVEPLFSPRIADTVAREAGAKTAVLNPIEGLTDAEVERGADYVTVMRANLAALRRALACR